MGLRFVFLRFVFLLALALETQAEEICQGESLPMTL
jgi:hypothetical protein